MVHISLTTEEAAILKEALDSYTAELRMEIADTDALAFREPLKQQLEFFKRLLRQLDHALAATDEAP
jgi:hypothetical protein